MSQEQILRIKLSLTIYLLLVCEMPSEGDTELNACKNVLDHICHFLEFFLLD